MLGTSNHSPIVYVIAALLLLTMLSTPSPFDTAAGGPGDTVGPAADTSAPRYQAFSPDPQYPGPGRPVDVTARVMDESDNLSVNVSYGYDNSTWTTVSASKSGNMTQQLTDRNPASGSTSGTLARTYTPNAEITHLNVYIYSADHDSCWVRIRGYDPMTSTWTNLYYSTSTNDGTKLDADLWGSGYTQWDIRFYDTEGNDAIYYTSTYRVLHQNYTARIPAAGVQPKVYYFFNTTDPSGNYAVSNVMNYTVDTTPPMIIGFTKPPTLQRKAGSIPIYTNISDPLGLGEAYLNYSHDGSQWYRVLMSVSSGTSTAAEYVGQLPAPPRNTTVYLRIEAYDAGGNHNNTTSHSFRWDPPPTITDVNNTPTYPNHLST